MYSLEDMRSMMSADASTSVDTTPAREEAKEDFSAMLDNIDRLFVDRKYSECYAACAEILKKDPKNPLALIYTALTDKAGYAVDKTNWSYSNMIIALISPISDLASRTGDDVDVYFSSCMRILRYIAQFESKYRSACRTQSQIEFNNTIFLVGDFRSDHTREIEMKKYEIERLKRESTAEIVSRCAEIVARSNDRLTVEQIRKLASNYSLPSARKYIDAAEERAREEGRRKREAEARRRKQKALAIAAWWESHPDEKAQIDARIQDLMRQIAESDQECDALGKKRERAIIERDKKGDAEVEYERVRSQLEDQRRSLRQSESRKIPPTASETKLSAAKNNLITRRAKLNHLRDSAMPSAQSRNTLVSEYHELEKELASLGPLSWGKKRNLTALLEQKKSELEDVEARIADELSSEQARLRDEIAALEAKVSDLKPLAAEEREAEEANRYSEIEETKSKIAELESVVEQATQHAEAEKKARHDRLQPSIEDASEQLTAAQKRNEALRQDLAKAKNDLASPALPDDFLEGFVCEDVSSVDERSAVLMEDDSVAAQATEAAPSVVITDFGRNKIAVIAAIRNDTSLSLRDAKDAVETGIPIKCQTRAMALSLMAAIKAAGGSAKLFEEDDNVDARASEAAPTVVVTGFGLNKIAVIAAVRNETYLSLRDAKNAVETGSPIKCQTRATALRVVAAVKAAGGSAKLG